MFRQAGTLVGSAYHQEQVAVPGLHVQHLDIGVIGGLDVEELAVPVVADVDDQGICSQRRNWPILALVPVSRTWFDVGGVHAQEDTSDGGMVRWPKWLLLAGEPIRPRAVQLVNGMYSVFCSPSRSSLDRPAGAADGQHNVINFYSVSDEYGCFSNFAAYPIRLQGQDLADIGALFSGTEVRGRWTSGCHSQGELGDASGPHGAGPQEEIAT